MMKYLFLPGLLMMITIAGSAQAVDSTTHKGHYINTPNGPLRTGGYKPVRTASPTRDTVKIEEIKTASKVTVSPTLKPSKSRYCNHRRRAAKLRKVYQKGG